MIKIRRYSLLADFDKVSCFIDKNYDSDTLNSYLLRPFFEYAHTHPAFNHKLTHRFGLWEDDGKLVGVTCYEMDLGGCYISVKEGYENLFQEIVDYSEDELAKAIDNKRKLGVWITDKERQKSKILQEKGYKKVYSEPVNIFTYDKEFLEVKLPEGFSIISLEDENDFKKINDCLWKGFNHGPEPDDDLDCRMLMQSGPNFSKELTTIIKAPNGDYACFAGMWFNEANKYAYLEPLATTPEYRKMGLATIALTEGMKKTKLLGAKYCFGGMFDYYKKIGFETICYREKWEKEWAVKG